MFDPESVGEENRSCLKINLRYMAQKKTSEVDYSMQEKIMALYELQKIDSQVDEINKVKGELPLEV